VAAREGSARSAGRQGSEMLHSRWMRGLAVAVVLSMAGAAWAQDEPVAEETVVDGSATARPFYFGLGVGGVFGLKGGVNGAFRIEEDIGYHVWSVGNHPGLFIGLLANQAFKSDWVLADIDVRAGFDINVYDWGSGRLLVTPGLALGVAIVHVSIPDPFGGSAVSDTSALFDLMFNTELRAVLVDGLLTVWFRPVGLEVTAKDGAGVNWDLNGGVLLNF
jgi:hypothetical protein